MRSFDGATLTLDDGRVLPREAVLEIRLSQPKPEAAAAAPGADAALAARGRELFKEAAAFGRRFPGSDGLVLLDEGEQVLRPDGTRVERYHYVAQVLSDRLKTSWGQVMLAYEDGRDRPRIAQATVYQPDGSAFPLEPSGIKREEPQSEMLFFEERRQLSYALPQVAVGSIIEWRTERDTYNPFRKDFFFPRWGFRNGQPTLLSRFSVTVPAGRTLYWSARHFRGGAAPAVATRDGSTTYEWRRRDQPAIPREPQAVPYGDYAPEVKAALMKDWSPIYDWLRAMHEEHMKDGPELAAEARKLVAGAEGDDAKIAALYRYVQKTVRYVAVQISVAAGFGGYDANVTWKRGYGCCIDKAILFASMLRAVGIRAEPVILDTNLSARHDFSVPDIGFEHAITRVRAGGRDFLLDATGEDYRYPSYAEMDHGVSVLDPEARQVAAFPLPKPEDNGSWADYELALSSSGDADVSASFVDRGAPEAATRQYFKSQKDSDIRRALQTWVAEISPAARLTSFVVKDMEDLTKAPTFTMRYALPDYPIRAADLLILKLPEWERDYDEVALGKRELGLRYSSSDMVARRYTVRLPEGWTPVSTPARRRLTGPRESYEQDCAADGRLLRCRSTLRREARVYEPSEYAAHKRFLEAVSRASKDRVFLKRGGS